MLHEHIDESIIGRISKTPYRRMSGAPGVIPFYEVPVFLSLAEEAAVATGRHGGKDLVLVADQETCGQVHVLEELRHQAKRVFVLGEQPPGWHYAENVTTRVPAEAFAQGDRVLILISSNVAIAILGSRRPTREKDEFTFVGGWSVHWDYVAHAVRALAGSEGDEYIAQMVAPREGSAQVADTAMDLMALQAEALAERQHDIAMDKNDLFSVLNILKAISAKRRAHDILFIFVDQIARVVSSNRCSVVRVWGSEETGQVLASHEDSSVCDYQIEIAKYPEIQKAMATHEKVVINDVRHDPLTANCVPELERANIHALLVIPIVLFDQNIGSLLLRAARSKGSFSLREISFFEIVTEAASNALERAHLFESIQVANEALERLAITDGLTGLYNHRYFRERLDQEMERALRYRTPLSCMIFDVDNFKQFNDTYGHLLGDNILKEMGERTVNCVRKSDIVARYGGEEFIVIMPETDLAGALSQAKRLRQTIESPTFAGVPEGVKVTASIGVSMLQHDTMLGAEDLIRSADQALFRAKRAGKNRVEGPETKE